MYILSCTNNSLSLLCSWLHSPQYGLYRFRRCPGSASTRSRDATGGASSSSSLAKLVRLLRLSGGGSGERRTLGVVNKR